MDIDENGNGGDNRYLNYNDDLLNIIKKYELKDKETEKKIKELYDYFKISNYQPTDIARFELASSVRRIIRLTFPEYFKESD